MSFIVYYSGDQENKDKRTDDNTALKELENALLTSREICNELSKTVIIITKLVIFSEYEYRVYLLQTPSIPFSFLLSLFFTFLISFIFHLTSTSLSISRIFYLFTTILSSCFSFLLFSSLLPLVLSSSVLSPGNRSELVRPSHPTSLSASSPYSQHVHSAMDGCPAVRCR